MTTRLYQKVIEGRSDIRRAITRMRQAYPNAARLGCLEELYDVMADSITYPPPVKDGRLKGSAYAAPTDAGAEAGYGTVYARFQHYEHRERSLFLETPWNRAQYGMLTRIAKRINRIISRMRGSATDVAMPPPPPGILRAPPPEDEP